MSKKGQALVEFVIVLPILLLILLAVLDIANIYQKKIELEDMITDVIENEDANIDNSVTLTKEENSVDTTFKLSAKVDLVSPILNGLMGNPYKVTITRTIPNE